MAGTIPEPRKEAPPTDVWLITYGDLLTLLLTFFVLLYASLSNAAASGVGAGLQQYQAVFYRQIATSAAGASGVIRSLPGGGSDLLQRDLTDFSQRTAGPVTVEQIGNSVKVTLGSDILFATSSSVLTPGAESTLTDLAGVLRRHPEQGILISGHTDSVPFAAGNTEFVDNLGLSCARAASVDRLFQREGLDPERMRVVGYGDRMPRPGKGLTGAEYDAWQRRVEVVLTPMADRAARDEEAMFGPEGPAKLLADTTRREDATELTPMHGAPGEGDEAAEGGPVSPGTGGDVGGQPAPAGGWPAFSFPAELTRPTGPAGEAAALGAAAGAWGAPTVEETAPAPVEAEAAPAAESP